MKLRAGLRGKVLLATALAVLVVVLASAWTAGYYFIERQGVAQRSRAQAIAETLAIQLERILALDIPVHELQGFDEQCDEALGRHQGLSFAVVVDRRGALLFRNRVMGSPPPPLPAGVPAAFGRTDNGHQWVAARVRGSDGADVAGVIVGFPQEALIAERDELILRVAGAGTLALLAMLGLLYAGLSRVLVRPLGTIVEAVARLQAGDRQARVRVPEGHDDELVLLAQTFNGLVETILTRETDLVAARDSAEQASRAKSQFLAIMSHELRTPLNAVLGMAEVLAGTPLTPRQQHLLKQVKTSGRQLADLLTDLLDLSALDAGKLQVVLQPVSLRQTVTEAVEMFDDEAARRGLALGLDIDPALPERLLGDAQRIRQVLVNLLSNAMKFTETGSVRVSVTPAGANVRLAVADTGVGIDDDFLPCIYEAFRQADGSLSRRFGGAGLGLTISRELCLAMGGHIDVATRPGKGSTFWFELPLRRADEAPATFDPVSQPAAPPAATRLREVLLIEDNPLNREYIEQGLDPSRWQLTPARDGSEGLVRLHARRYDAVLLDWQLPGIDGLSLLATLRQMEARSGAPRTPVIAVTAHAAPGDRETCLAAGVDDYLAKPFTLVALEAALVRAVGAADAAGNSASPRQAGPRS